MTDHQASETQNSSNPVFRIFVNLAMILVLGVLAILIWQRVTTGRAEGPNTSNSLAMEVESSINEVSVDLPALSPQDQDDPLYTGLYRVSDFETIIPSRSRTDVITYTVQKGDTLFAIAEKFGIKPETVLWGNFDVLEDNPHLLSPDQVLNILPIDGTFYQWHDGDNVGQVASNFNVEPENILEFSGNEVDLASGPEANYGIQSGDWVIVPGGSRPIKDWGPPAITRSNPASARYYGEGHCGAVYSGAVGTGTFVWPTVLRSISGYPYSAIHPAIDIGGAMGNAIFAVDSGVVVYSGWSNYGYGNLIVIDHGNGFQSAYAHLSAVAVTCGQSVFQGGYIGAMGSTGNSSGPHLHFELIYNGAKPNPLDYLQ